MQEIRDSGGWETMTRQEIGPYTTMQVFDTDTALFKRLHRYIEFRTWGMRKGALTWLKMKAKLAEMDASSAAKEKPPDSASSE